MVNNNSNTTFSAAYLKHLALITMLIDHIGYVLLPDVMLLRYIGRLSFIIFAFLIAEGALHTRSRLKYCARLLAVAIISQPIYSYAKHSDAFVLKDLNVFFLLASAVMMLSAIDYVKGWRFEYICKIVILGVFSLAGRCLHIEYDFYGYALAACFYEFRGNKGNILIAATLITVALLPLWKILLFRWDIVNAVDYTLIESVGLISLFFILNYNGEKGGQIHKAFYYFFYPVHLSILILIKLL